MPQTVKQIQVVAQAAIDNDQNVQPTAFFDGAGAAFTPSSPTWASISGKPTTFAPPAATTSTVGGVKMAATQAASVASDVPTLVANFNTLLANLKAAGIVA